MRTRTVLRIGRNHTWFDECEWLSIITKQLYNVGIYTLRQALINNNEWLTAKQLYYKMKENENWTLLPRKVSNQVWKQVKTAWGSWLKALKSFKRNPSLFTSRPKIPGYNNSRNIVVYESGAIGLRGLKDGFRRLSKTNIIFNVSDFKIKEAKIIPKLGHYIVSFTYEKENSHEELDEDQIAGID